MFLPAVACAINAQWDLDPISGDWNTAANWTPLGVPNGPTDTATFALSNTTNISISANTEVNGITFTSAATNPYTITANSGLTLTISGAGITNNSGTTQNFVAGGDATGNGQIAFTNSATAGTGTSFTANGGIVSGGGVGQIEFFNTSTAGSGTFTSNAGTASGTIGGFIQFLDNSTAANGTFIANGGTVSDSNRGHVDFYNTSTAGNGTFTNNGGSFSGELGGTTRF